MKKALCVAFIACMVASMSQAETLQERKARLQAELNALENASSNEAQLQELKSYRKNLLQEQKAINQPQPNREMQSREAQSTTQSAKPQTKKSNEDINLKAKMMKSGWIGGVEGAYVMPLKYSYSYSCDSNVGICDNTSLTSAAESLADPANKKYYTSWAIGVLGGYQYFFNPYFGLRGTIGLGYGQHTEVKNRDFYMFSGDIYILAEYAFGSEKSSSIGLLGGVGYRGFYYGQQYTMGVGSMPEGTGGITYNLGLSFGYDYVNRIELMAKYFPIEDDDGFSSSSSNGRYADIKAKTKHDNLMFVISYIKVF